MSPDTENDEIRGVGPTEEQPPILISKEELIVGQLYRLDFHTLFVKCKDNLETVAEEIKTSHGFSMLLCDISHNKLTREIEYKFLSGSTVQIFSYSNISPWLRHSSYKHGNKKYWSRPDRITFTPAFERS